MITRSCLFCIGIIVTVSILTAAVSPDILASRIPTTGRVLENDINIRTDSTVTAYSIGTLNRNEEVEIIGEKYGWFKIRLPEGFSCYVSGDHVKRVGRDKVQVLAFSLNMRLEPTLDAPIVGKVREGMILTLVGTKGAWVKIIAYPYAWGWIHKKFIEENQTAGSSGDAMQEDVGAPEAAVPAKEKIAGAESRKFVAVARESVSAIVAIEPAPEPEITVVKREVVDLEPAVPPEPMASEPVVQDPVVPKPMPQEPIVQDSVVPKPMAQEPVASQPVKEEAKLPNPSAPDAASQVITETAVPLPVGEMVSEKPVPYVRVIAGALGQEEDSLPETAVPEVNVVESVLALKQEPQEAEETIESVNIMEKVAALTRPEPEPVLETVSVPETASVTDVVAPDESSPESISQKMVKILKTQLDIEPFTNARLDDPRVYGVLERIDRKMKGCRANFRGKGQEGDVLLKIDQGKFNADHFLDKKVEIRGKVKDEGCLYIDVQTLSLL